MGINDDLVANDKLNKCFAKDLVTRDDVSGVEFDFLLCLWMNYCVSSMKWVLWRLWLTKLL